MGKLLVKIMVWGLFIMVCTLPASHAAAESIIFSENFEGTPAYIIENGVWEVGVPESGPGSAFEGVYAVGTELTANYPTDIDSRLIIPASDYVMIPSLEGDEEIHLRFWNWFDYAQSDWGAVEISLLDEDKHEWTNWDIIDSNFNNSSHGWFIKDIDITRFQGKKIRIAFWHRSSSDSYTSAGWFIDDIQIIKSTPSFTGDFEDGWQNWASSHGIWQITDNPNGPDNCHEGNSCIGTMANGDYPKNTDSRLISSSITLPSTKNNEEIHLRFWNWFDYAQSDWGAVEISLLDEDKHEWTNWDIIDSNFNNSSHGWFIKDIDITRFQGKKIRIAFWHRSSSDSYTSTGWFIDDIKIKTMIPLFSGDFELGWEDWTSSHGIWEVGSPTAGPEHCYNGQSCSGTVLSSNYPAASSSILVSPSINLQHCDLDELFLTFYEWRDYEAGDTGNVYISVLDPQNHQWSSWQICSYDHNYDESWHQITINLSEHTQSTFKIGFMHRSNYDSKSGAGWYIDDVELIGEAYPMPVITNILYDKYIPYCNSAIMIETDSCNEDLDYIWNIPEDCDIEGNGSEVVFIPGVTMLEPYSVTVCTVSDTPHIRSLMKSFNIFTEIIYDLNRDDDIDGEDVATLINSGDSITREQLERVAEEFGITACQYAE